MAAWIETSRENQFPFLTRALYQKTSEETPDFKYNCAGYVVGDVSNWWQPPDSDDEEPLWFWPLGVPKDGLVASYVKVYESFGFVLCGPEIEEGFQRIALYSYPDGVFAHAALQLPDGSWTSKLGEWEDIRHLTLTALEGLRPAYGFANHWMKRPLPA